MPDSRLMSMRTRPRTSRWRRAQMRSRASAQAADQRIFFFLETSGGTQTILIGNPLFVFGGRTFRSGYSDVECALDLRSAIQQSLRQIHAQLPDDLTSCHVGED